MSSLAIWKRFQNHGTATADHVHEHVNVHVHVDVNVDVYVVVDVLVNVIGFFLVTAVMVLCNERCLAGEPGMVFIPGGEFSRGRSYDWPDTRLPWYPNPLKDDTPVRKVYVDPFYMDEAEVTNERYAAFVKATRRKPPYQWLRGEIQKGKENHPVVNVSWDDAAAFCSWDGKRLPTEAEWERACRGFAEGRMFPWGDANPTDKQAVFNSDTGAEMVCSKERNDFGLCDIIGNVWEWTADWYDRNYYETAPDRNPPGPAEGLYRVLRGGSWFDQPNLFLTCSYRSWARQSERSPTIGFRCVRDPKGAQDLR